MSFEPYSLDWNNELKTKIRERDNYTCQICKVNGKGIHHIDYNKQNCKESNLITLCRSCHSKTNTNREYWISHFYQIIKIQEVLNV